MNGIIHEKKTDIYYPCRVRRFPDGWVEELYADRPIFGGRGWEKASVSRETMPETPRPGAESEEIADESAVSALDTPDGNESDKTDTIRACRRAKAAVRTLCHCAEMRYFVTLTLDAAKIDRYDEKAIIRKMSQWCDNMVRRHGLVYILVPEHHKDGALHFHGFFNAALPVADSGTITVSGRKKPIRPRGKRERERMLAEGGHIVYNLPAWKLGFTTAIELYGRKEQAIAYACKYLTKQMDGGGKIGGRWYYHGGDFQQYEETYLDIDLRAVLTEGGCQWHFDIPEAGFSLGGRYYTRTDVR